MADGSGGTHFAASVWGEAKANFMPDQFVINPLDGRASDQEMKRGIAVAGCKGFYETRVVCVLERKVMPLIAFLTMRRGHLL